MSEMKTQPTGQSVTAFIDSVDNAGRREDAFALLELMNGITGAKPQMWGDGLIGYGTYPYKRADGSEHTFFVTGFSPRKANLVVYLMRGVAQQQENLAKLGKHKHSVSCLYLGRLKSIEMDVLEQLIRNDIAAMRDAYPDLVL